MSYVLNIMRINNKNVCFENHCIMASWWRILCCYAHYRFVSWVCARIKVLVYEDKVPHRIPHEWVPSRMIEDVYKHAMKLHWYRSHIPNHHLMTFMRYYEGK